jgi:hypothetical protein
MAVDGPEAIGPHPEGAGMKWRAAGRDFLDPRGMAAKPSGEESRDQPLRGQERDRAQRDRPSVRPATSRTQLGVPVAETPGMKTGVLSSVLPCKPPKRPGRPSPATTNHQVQAQGRVPGHRPATPPLLDRPISPLAPWLSSKEDCRGFSSYRIEAGPHRRPPLARRIAQFIVLSRRTITEMNRR